MNLPKTCMEKPSKTEAFICHFVQIFMGILHCFQEQMLVFWSSEASELNEDISINFIDSAFLI